MRGFRVATLAGIPLEINPTWLVIFGLLVWSLSRGLFPAYYPDLPAATYWTMGLAGTLLLFASLVAHELSHSLVSRHFGLEVRRITLFLFGGVSESVREMPSARAEFWIAIAGPLMSFAIAGVAGLLTLLLAPAGAAFVGPVSWLAGINLALGLFNLLPGYPLDGGRVLRAASWHLTGDLRRATRLASRGGQLIGGLLMLFAGVQLFAGNLFGAVWIGFLGYLLFQTAAAAFVDVVARGALREVSVGELMSDRPVVLSPETTLREVVDRYLLHLPFGGYPVVDGELAGILQTNAIKAVPHERWPTSRVREVMVPLDAGAALHPEEPASEALERLGELNVGRLPVVDHTGQVVGVLSQTDVVRWLMWHPEIDDGRAPRT